MWNKYQYLLLLFFTINLCNCMKEEEQKEAMEKIIKEKKLRGGAGKSSSKGKGSKKTVSTADLSRIIAQQGSGTKIPGHAVSTDDLSRIIAQQGSGTQTPGHAVSSADLSRIVGSGTQTPGHAVTSADLSRIIAQQGSGTPTPGHAVSSADLSRIIAQKGSDTQTPGHAVSSADLSRIIAQKGSDTQIPGHAVSSADLSRIIAQKGSGTQTPGHAVSSADLSRIIAQKGSDTQTPGHAVSSADLSRIIAQKGSDTQIPGHAVSSADLSRIIAQKGSGIQTPGHAVSSADLTRIIAQQGSGTPIPGHAGSSADLARIVGQTSASSPTGNVSFAELLSRLSTADPSEPTAATDVNLNILNKCRQESEWLDSSIIDAYLEKIVSSGRPGLEFVPNFIIDMYVGNKKEHAEEIGNWIIKIDWPAIQLLFVPVFLAPNHWAMGVYRPSDQEFTMFDSKTSLGRVDEKIEFMGKMTDFFADIGQIHGQIFDEDVHLVERTNVPQQDNTADCGVFALMFAYYIGKEARILDNFNHCNMNANAFREKIYQDLHAIKFSGQQASTAAGAAASTKITSLEQSAAEGESLGKNLPPVEQEGLSKSAKKKLKRNKSKLSTTSAEDEEKNMPGMTLRGDESAKEGRSKSGAMETVEETLRKNEKETLEKTLRRSESENISTGKTLRRSESGKESTGKVMRRSESVKESTRKTLRKSVSSKFSDTQEQLRRIDEIAVLKDGAHTWRVKDMHLFGKNFLRVLNDDITGNAMHSAVEILKKGDNSIEAYVKRNLRMPFAKAMVIQLLANGKSQTTNMKILNIGLGGGELANFLAELDPTMDITSVEISPTIIQIATEYFDYKIGEKQHVLNKDGIEYIEEAVRERNKFNWILIDACNLTEQNKLVCPVSGFINNRIAQFISQLMSERGILVINTYAAENSEEIKQERLAMKKIYEKHFSDCYFVEAGTNIIFTCVNGKKVDKKQYEEMEKKIRPIAGSWVKDALKVNTLFLPKL